MDNNDVITIKEEPETDAIASLLEQFEEEMEVKEEAIPDLPCVPIDWKPLEKSIETKSDGGDSDDDNVLDNNEYFGDGK